MHRHFTIALPATATDALLDELQRTRGVVSVAVHRGASVKPPGDVVSVDALNRGADAVLLAVERHRRDGALSVRSSQVASLSDRDHAAAIVDDSDQSTWEDGATALRHHAQLTVSFVALMISAA